MPRAPKPGSGRQRKRLASSAAVQAELDAMLSRLPKPTAEERVAAKKEDARFTRWTARGIAAWDALTADERQREAARMLADLRRHDREADDRDLGPDGGRAMYGTLFAVERQRKRWAKEDANTKRTSAYAAHRATSVRETPAGEAVRPAPASEEAPAADETPEPPKARRRRPAGLVGYIDPRLIDEDDWED